MQKTAKETQENEKVDDAVTNKDGEAAIKISQRHVISNNVAV